jgi:hypothetical protein
LGLIAIKLLGSTYNFAKAVLSPTNTIAVAGIVIRGLTSNAKQVFISGREIIWKIKENSWTNTKLLLKDPAKQTQYDDIANLIKSGCVVSAPSWIDRLLGTISTSACTINTNNYRLSSATNTRGFNVRPDYHYAKHGINDLANAGKPIVSQQQYFNDAYRFLNRYKSGVIKFEKYLEPVPAGTNLPTSTMVYKIKDPNTGWIGYITDDNIMVTFFYNI